jgi:imidazoleglycerol-phosphate dehydratase/histidinol-phosphatase
MKIAFIDRDGTIIEEPADEQIDSLAKYRLLPAAVEGLKAIQDAGFEIVIVTNQDGLGTERYPQAGYDQVQQKLMADLAAGGVRVRDVLVCPHFLADNCDCRKPKTGMLIDYIANPDIDWPASCVVGDRTTDTQLALALGARPIQVSRNLEDEKGFVEILKRVVLGSVDRVSAVQRKTKETRITARLNIDGHGAGVAKTGLGFFDHMLTAMLHHASIDYWVFCQGDLHVDEHHTIEDVAIVLGEALSKALGERKGIMRFGFLLPMDDALAQVAIDLGGRPYSVFNAKFDRERVGDLPTEMVSHFFETLAMHLRANIHIELKYAKNAHHAIESLFKCFGRALRMACESDPRNSAQVASTKGVL